MMSPLAPLPQTDQPLLILQTVIQTLPAYETVVNTAFVFNPSAPFGLKNPFWMLSRAQQPSPI